LISTCPCDFANAIFLDKLKGVVNVKIKTQVVHVKAADAILAKDVSLWKNDHWLAIFDFTLA
jgi:hypothetical protein